MAKKKDKMEAMTEALFKGSMTLQAVPMLRPSGRTTAALTDRAAGFVGIGVTGATADVAFKMVKAPYKMGLSKKKKKKYRR